MVHIRLSTLHDFYSDFDIADKPSRSVAKTLIIVFEILSSLHSQVKLEQIRQAESLNQVKHILGEEIEDSDFLADATWNNIRIGDILANQREKTLVDKEAVLKKGQAEVGCLHEKDIYSDMKN